LQCHVEMTADMVRDWCAAGMQELASETGNAAVQRADEMQRDLPQRINKLNALADRIYGRWIQGLRP